jgi:outer membrane receptor protein involved in Fe transport
MRATTFIRPIKHLALGGSAVALAVGVAAHAQAAPPADASADAPMQGANGIGPGDIIVTAQKREQNLIDVPLAVQAISGETLERTGVRSVTDLVDLVPGASVVSKSAPGFETIQIRGISAGTVGDTTTGYYIDDVVFSIPNLQLSPPARLFDLERTEVLRGPQGTLYGNGAMGGLIRLITATPSTTDFSVRGQGELSFTDGGGTNYAGDAVLNVPIAEDVAGLRVSGGYERLSGFGEALDRPGEKNLNDYHGWNIRGKLLLKPADNVSVTLGAWHIENRQDYTNVFNSVKPAILPNSFGTRPYNDVIATYYSGSVNIDLGGASLQSGTSYLDHTLKFDTTFNVRYDPETQTAATNLRAVARFKSHSFSQELRLVSDSGQPFNWIVGGIYTKAKILSQFDYTIPFQFGSSTLFLPLISASPSPLRSESYAVFGEASYELFDGKLIPLVGLRYFHDKRSASGTTTTFPTFTPPGIPLTGSVGAKFHSWNPRFNLTFKPGDNQTLYVNVAKGFRSGSIQSEGQVLFAAATGDPGVTTSVIIQPDKLWTYEAGAKFRSPDRKLSLEGAFYYTDWSNIQIPFTTVAGLVATVNGGNARLYGVELGVSWKTPLDGLTLQMVGNVNSAQFKSVDAGLAAALRTARKGRRLPGTPSATLTFAGSYLTSLTDSLNLSVYSAYSYRDRQSDLASGLLTPPLDQMTLRAGVESKRLRVQLFADNLLNEKGPVLASTTGLQAVYPRRIGINVGLNY